MVVSNTSLSGVARGARSAARENFAFFTRHVMGLATPAEVCEELQSFIEDGEAERCEVLVKRPSILCTALSAWLRVNGFTVQCAHSDHKVPETVSWLFEEEETGDLPSFEVDITPYSILVVRI